MIEFLNEAVRREFHLFPLDRQRGIQEWADYLEKKGQTLKVLCIEIITEKISEIAIRIDQKFDHSA